jgi:hypothetical protein
MFWLGHEQEVVPGLAVRVGGSGGIDARDRAVEAFDGQRAELGWRLFERLDEDRDRCVLRVR